MTIVGKKIENGEDFWTVTFSHSDWGRDSIDSFEDKDYCSKECLAATFLKYLEESSNPKNNPNTMKMNIERQHYFDFTPEINFDEYEARYVRKDDTEDGDVCEE